MNAAPAPEIVMHRLYARRAALLRELADLEIELGQAHEAAAAARPVEIPDAVLSLPEAAALVGEPPSTFRRRATYLRALVSLPHERRLRYSRRALEHIKRERLEASRMLSR